MSRPASIAYKGPGTTQERTSSASASAEAWSATGALQGGLTQSSAMQKVAGRLVAAFAVPGICVPKGQLNRSKYGRTYFPTHVVKWCATVALAAQADYRSRHGASAAPRPGPLRVVCEFTFERPKSHGASRATLRVSRRPPKTLPECTSHHLGDVDKLCRAVLDALVDGGVIYDDSHVTELVASKRYCTAGETPGVAVRVEAI